MVDSQILEVDDLWPDIYCRTIKLDKGLFSFSTDGVYLFACTQKSGPVRTLSARVCSGDMN